MTDARLPVIDADGHVTEPPTVWTEYVEEAYRGRAPRFALDEHAHHLAGVAVHVGAKI